MVRRPSPAVFRSKDLDEFLETLELDHKFRRWIGDMEAVLKENIYVGQLVKKKQIPSLYIQRYGVNNLYRYSHPGISLMLHDFLREGSRGVPPYIRYDVP